MATEVVVAERPSFLARTMTFLQDVRAEMKKVTWPDRPQVQQLTLLVIGLSLFIGVVIWLLDLGLQGALVRLPAIILGG